VIALGHQKSIIVSAPSGAGKTTLVRHILQHRKDIAFSVSATTRAARAQELDGKDYHFLDLAAFKDAVAKGRFVEYEEVYAGVWYGTLWSELERIWASRSFPIFDVDVVGGLRLKRLFGPRALALFVSLPSLTMLEERLKGRGTETPETLRARVSKATHEMAFASQFDKVVVNDDRQRASEEALTAVDEFLRA
jgi:guanylate kinase